MDSSGHVRPPVHVAIITIISTSVPRPAIRVNAIVRSFVLQTRAREEKRTCSSQRVGPKNFLSTTVGYLQRLRFVCSERITRRYIHGRIRDREYDLGVFRFVLRAPNSKQTSVDVLRAHFINREK